MMYVPKRRKMLPGDMKYKVQDERYRDVYDERDRKRVTRETPQTNRNNLIIAWSAGIAIWLVEGMAWYLLGGVLTQLMSLGKMKASTPSGIELIGSFLWPANKMWWLFTLSIPVICAYVLYVALEKNRKVQNIKTDTSTLNQYEGDSRLKQPEELAKDYDIFPDDGAHSDVDVTALLSHIMITNKGLKKATVTKRYPEETEIEYDDGSIETAHVDDAVRDDEDNVETQSLPMIDEKFAHELYDASGVPENSHAQHFYNAGQLIYNDNPAAHLGKAKLKTVADKINSDWEIPEYEMTRPAGMYVVDTEPNNTMVLAMTRAGKGQTVIEPTIDMWLRSKTKSNLAINDPKGELYTKFYYPAIRRGYDVVAFNLINPSRTNIYNPLGYAVDAARKGDIGKVTEFVNTIGDVFFPTDDADDPMWPSAANAAFKRSAFGLIDYYTEEDHQMQQRAHREHWATAVLNRRLDVLWGHVTLYNVYQMMTQLASKKTTKLDDYGLPKLTSDDHDDDEDKPAANPAEPPEEKDYLTAFFDATAMLPTNNLRRATANQDNSLRAMAGSDKTIASVYGISLTAILFFADEKISRLTSGRPSQNFDMSGLAFPRRIEVRLDKKYMRAHGMQMQQYQWSAYDDANFTHKLGKDFDHNGEVNTEGWILYAFKGIFPHHSAYLKLDIIERDSKLPMHTFYFKFNKGFLTSLNGKTRVMDPITDKHVISNGTVIELSKITNADGTTKFVPKATETEHVRKSLVVNEEGQEQSDPVPAIAQTSVHYTEKPKMVFFVTPPHLMSYAKIILILLNQMFNMQVDMAYTTKKNQKPLYKTKYMLDEVGNLQSEGHGIPFISTKESIGLGQSQQYTLILQTLAQLQDLYGDSIDKILQGNTGNIIYLKSTDDSMLDTLEKMSGNRHVSMKSSRSVTSDISRVINPVDGKITESTSVQERPVITKNDMLLIPKANNMVFGKGNPIWSRNQLALPMAWKLHLNRLPHASGVDGYQLNTVPSSSNTDDFDILGNQPDFFAMVAKRCEQAELAQTTRQQYQKVYDLTDDQMNRIDPDTLAEDLMEGINEQVAANHNTLQAQREQKQADTATFAANIEAYEKQQAQTLRDNGVDNTEVMNVQASQQARVNDIKAPRYATVISREALVGSNGHTYKHTDMDAIIATAYGRTLTQFQHDAHFKMNEYHSLYSADGTTCFIEAVDDPHTHAHDDMQKVQNDDNVHTMNVDDSSTQVADAEKYVPTDAFYDYLVGLNDWHDVAQRAFEMQMKNLYLQRDNANSKL